MSVMSLLSADSFVDLKEIWHSVDFDRLGITFDDGFRNVFENALPVLSDLGFTSTNYFVANQFDGGNVWDREKKIPFSPLMSRTEVRAWAAAGQEVGSHTLDHVHLPEVSHDEARRQIRLSREILAQESGAEVTAFCYPYGDFTSEHGLGTLLQPPRTVVWRTLPMTRSFYPG